VDGCKDQETEFLALYPSRGIKKNAFCPAPFIFYQRLIKFFYTYTQDIQMDMSEIMRQAQEFQQKMNQVQNELADRVVTASVGGGMVSVTVNGKNELISIQIEKDYPD
jgi:hypothetical protein